MEKEKKELELYGNTENEPRLIKSLKYFTNLLNKFLQTHSEDYILKTELCDFAEHLENDINTYIYKLYNDELLIYQSELIGLIADMKIHETNCLCREKPITPNLKPYYEKATSKILSVFNRNIPYTSEEARNKYSDIDCLERKYKIFIEFIEWCNENGLSVIPDRIMFCAYMQINLDTYQEFLTSGNNEKIQSVFQAIENYIISLRLSAGEIGTRNSNAIKTNVSYDKVGNSLSPKDNGQTINKNLIITNEDIFNKMRALGFNSDLEKRKKESDIIDYTK